MLKTIFELFNKFLSFILFICFLFFIFIQYKVFILKVSLKEIDLEINKIKHKNAILDVEISYLTDPERLIKIYKEIYGNDYSNNLVTIKQMKNMTEILLYHHNKNKENNKNE